MVLTDMTPTISLNGKIHSFRTPAVMGIINVTPDSFFSGSRTLMPDALSKRVEGMIRDGVDIFDVGGYSSRPGAEDITPEIEFSRLAPAIETIRSLAPDIPISIDTFRARIAERCIDEYGVEIINDISGGDLDPEMFDVVAEKNCGYVLMHMRGNPQNMSSLTQYNDVVADVIRDLSFKMAQLRQKGIADVIIDPGFGFAKNNPQNFHLLRSLPYFKELGAPLLVGISRKTMIWKTLDKTPETSLNGTTVLNTVALLKGADILRVHDVAEAVECVRLIRELNSSSQY